jgi:hypothetical protein
MRRTTATDRWKQRAPMPTARCGVAAAVLDGLMFVFEGEAPSMPTWKVASVA